MGLSDTHGIFKYLADGFFDCVKTVPSHHVLDPAGSNDPFARAQNILQHGEASVRIGQPPKRRPANLSRKVCMQRPPIITR